MLSLRQLEFEMATVRRPFTCEFCGHKMRFFGTRCSYCHTARPLVQQGGFYTSAFAVVLVGCLALLLA